MMSRFGKCKACGGVRITSLAVHTGSLEKSVEDQIKEKVGKSECFCPSYLKKRDKYMKVIKSSVTEARGGENK